MRDLCGANAHARPIQRQHACRARKARAVLTALTLRPAGTGSCRVLHSCPARGWAGACSEGAAGEAGSAGLDHCPACLGPVHAGGCACV